MDAIADAIHLSRDPGLEVRAYRPNLFLAVPLSMPWMLSLPGHFSWQACHAASSVRQNDLSKMIRLGSGLSVGCAIVGYRTRRRRRLRVADAALSPAEVKEFSHDLA